MTLKIRHKVLLPALSVISVLLVLAAYSYYSIWQIKRQARDLDDYYLPGDLEVRNMRPLLEEVARWGKLAATSPDPVFRERFDASRQQLDNAILALFQREPAGAEPEHRNFRQAVAKLNTALEAYTTEAPEAELIAEREAGETLGDLEKLYSRRVERGVGEVARVARVASRYTQYALVAGLLVSIIVWVLILWSLSRPLKELVRGTERVAEGRFTEPIQVKSEDELGALSAAFNRMAASLSELDRMKAEFVASASHELKTPLTCIKGLATVLRSGSRGPLTQEQRETLVQVEEQVDQVTRFVTELLDLSRLRAGRLTMNVRSLPAEAFFASVARGFEGLAEKQGIRYALRISPSLPARIDADPDRLREVVYNLLGNAFKFTEPGGVVEFDAEPDAGWVKVSVLDSGPGIPQQDLPFIFEKFYRGAEGDGKRGKEGAGLGLAIARGIIETHGGRIWVESHAGSGSRFVFRIPAIATDRV